jgi:hypothetical protein
MRTRGTALIRGSDHTLPNSCSEETPPRFYYSGPGARHRIDSAEAPRELIGT